MLRKMRAKVTLGTQGFTLIELMIVIAIIGILAAIAIPNFMNYQCKAKQSEAKANLGNIRTAEEAYYAEYDNYTTSLTDIGFATKGTARYEYTIDDIVTSTVATADAFTASATGASVGKGDSWTITHAGALEIQSNGCE